MLATIVVIAVSLLLFIATQFFFPIDRDDPTSTKQKHFWSIMLTMFSMVLGFSMKASYETHARLESVASVFRKLSSQEIERDFQELFTLYHQHFDHAQPVLKGWAEEALTQLLGDMRRGYISIPRELAAQQIGKVYPYAKTSIVATNVGGTRFYFANRTYSDLNVAARDRGVPVIRFYLYSARQRIEMSDMREAKNINEFFDEVKKLHKRLGTVYSCVIDVDTSQLPEERDLLILDNVFSAETQLSPNWEAIRAKATEDVDRLKDAREYIRSLLGRVDERYVVMMTDEEVRQHFHQYEREEGKTVGKLAERIFRDVMGRITGPN